MEEFSSTMSVEFLLTRSTNMSRDQVLHFKRDAERRRNNQNFKASISREDGPRRSYLQDDMKFLKYIQSKKKMIIYRKEIRMTTIT